MQKLHQSPNYPENNFSVTQIAIFIPPYAELTQINNP